jgi:hypothetical protein
MARYVTTEISGTQCIGDSRVVINTNFENLDTKIQTLSTNTLTLSTTSTVQFIGNFDPVTRRIAAFVRPASIDNTHLASDSVTTAKLSAQAVTTDKIAPNTVRYSQLASWQTLSASPTLSAEAVQPRLAKAWVNFDGTGTVSIRNAFNVSSVTDNNIGDYTVNFIRPMNNLGYVIAGTVMDTTPNDIGGIIYISTSTARSLSSVQIKCTAVEGGIWVFDSPNISLLVFDV